MGLKKHPIIKAAEEELESLLKLQSDLDEKRAKNSKKISAVARTIENLRQVYGQPAKKSRAEELHEEYFSHTLGLTDQIREVLKNRYPNWLPPTVVKAYLQRRGFSIGEYANPMAVIHQVLHRLDGQGWAESEPLKEGGKAYRVKRISLGRNASTSMKIESVKDVALAAQPEEMGYFRKKSLKQSKRRAAQEEK